MPVNETGTITLRLLAQDLASGNVSKFIGHIDTIAKKGGLMGSVLQGVGQSFGQMLNPVGLVKDAIGGVVTGLGDAMNAAAEETAAIAKLNTAISENDAAWDGNIDKIEAVIAARQRDFAFADGDQREAIARLTSVTKDHNVALDLSRQAMDLARLKQMSLVDASELLGKVYGGNVGILSRYGIQLRRGATAQEALAEIQKRAAGQARTYGESSASASVRLSQTLDDLMENMGHLIEGPGAMFLGFLNNVVLTIGGPSGASASIRDLTGTIVALRTQADALTRVSPFEALANDLAGWSQELRQAEELYKNTTWFDWMARLGPDTLRNFGKAGAETFADVRALAQGVIDAGGSFEQFAMTVREKIAPSFNVLTSTWGTTMRTIEGETRQTAKNVAGIAWNIPTGVADALRGGKQDVRSAMRELVWVMNHPWAGAKQRAFIQAKLTGDRMVKGINSKNPDIRQAAIDARSALLTAWNALPGKAMELGRLTIAELVRGLSEGEQYALGLYGSTGTQSGDRKVRNRTRPNRHAGGPVMAGETYTVGGPGAEERLTLFPGGGGHVTPMRGGGGGRGGDMHIHFHGLVSMPSEADIDRMGRQLEPVIRRALAATA